MDCESEAIFHGNPLIAVEIISLWTEVFFERRSEQYRRPQSVPGLLKILVCVIKAVILLSPLSSVFCVTRIFALSFFLCVFFFFL